MSSADTTAVNLAAMKTLLCDDLSTFFINTNPNFINGPRSLPRNPPDCTIKDSILASELFAIKLYEVLKLVYLLVIIRLEN